MSLTLSDVKRIAHLAQLEMADDQAVTSLAQLNKIFALAEQMQAVNTD
ncbi:MAG: aspartyl/glutamyl-tRNA amidotransferase subunit C, partial [Janthinobacterium lividum]|nr:aspartyl/glutamyl-tRNA amidotransferase subunit C [Janthinobacterium lividum]